MAQSKKSRFRSGRTRSKSANTQESPTGYRSRGPSAARQERCFARRGDELSRRAQEDERRIDAMFAARMAIRERRKSSPEMPG